MLKRKMLETLLIWCIPSLTFKNLKIKRYGSLALQLFDLSICNTAISKKYFSMGPLMFNVSNKALITWFVTQSNGVKVIYISKVTWAEVRPKSVIYITLFGSVHSTGLVLLIFGVEMPGCHLLGTAKDTQCGADRSHIYIYIYIYIYT